MDVDARERRPGGGRRDVPPRERRRKRAGPAATDRGTLMEKPTGLYTIQEPETPARSNVFQFNAIRSYPHGLVTARPLGAPWPRQVAWHDVPASA
jgi:hypothetical protein